MTTRTYESALRAEQSAQTREKLLRAASELVIDPSAELTVAEVAARAKVSVRTAYRYFPTREALLDAFNAWRVSRIGDLTLPGAADDLPRFVDALYRHFERNAELFRATRMTKSGLALRERRRAQQVRMLEKSFASATRGLDATAARRLRAQIHSLISFDTYWNLVDTWKMSREEATATTLDAASALVARAQRARR